MRPRLIAFAATVLLSVAPVAAQAAKPVPPPTVGPLNPDTFYKGMWYEQARTPTSLTKGCEHATTQHGRNAEGRITVRDACLQGGPKGAERAIEGLGTIRDPGQNAALKVRYRLGPFRIAREYRIIAVGPAGEWHISAEPKFDKIYIFTRAVAPPLAEVETLISKVRALGYAGAVEILATPGRE